MSVIRSVRLGGAEFLGNGAQNVVTAVPGQTLVVNYLTARALAGGPFDVLFYVNVGAVNVPIAIVPARGVVNTGFVSLRAVLNPNDSLMCTPANGGPGWDYAVGAFGFALT